MPDLLTHEGDTKGFGQRWPCTDADEGPHEVRYSPGQHGQIWYASDHLSPGPALGTTWGSHGMRPAGQSARGQTNWSPTWTRLTGGTLSPTSWGQVLRPLPCPTA
jgi:hypothetical protein